MKTFTQGLHAPAHEWLLFAMESCTPGPRSPALGHSPNKWNDSLQLESHAPEHLALLYVTLCVLARSASLTRIHTLQLQRVIYHQFSSISYWHIEASLAGTACQRNCTYISTSYGETATCLRTSNSSSQRGIVWLIERSEAHICSLSHGVPVCRFRSAIANARCAHLAHPPRPRQRAREYRPSPVTYANILRLPPRT